MIRITSLMTLTGVLAACTSPDASPYDSGDPIHCMAIFGATSGTVRTGPLADELNARIVHRALKWPELVA